MSRELLRCSSPNEQGLLSITTVPKDAAAVDHGAAEIGGPAKKPGAFVPNRGWFGRQSRTTACQQSNNSHQSGHRLQSRLILHTIQRARPFGPGARVPRFLGPSRPPRSRPRHSATIGRTRRHGCELAEFSSPWNLPIPTKQGARFGHDEPASVCAMRLIDSAKRIRAGGR